ncbi:MAG: PepSY domain-containing protein [Clostridia bacterium]|nr:PepSY domain-containing protein [Clostridia bacterium]
MRKSLYVITLSALLIMTLLAGCYSEETLAESTIPTKGTEKQTVSTEASSAVVEAKPVEVKEEKPVLNEIKPTEAKEQKTVTEAKPAEVKEQKPVQPKEQKTAVKETKPAQPDRISRDEAKAKAITHAKVGNGKIRDLDIELEKERGVTFYEISFDVGNLEYEYAIEAYTGEILYNKTERD